MTFIVKDSADAEHFTAGDLCSLAEILHPKNESLPFSDFSISHRMVKSTEIYWIIEGSGTLFIDGIPIKLKKGRAVMVPPYAVQHVVNECDRKLEFLCIVSPPWDRSDEEII